MENLACLVCAAVDLDRCLAPLPSCAAYSGFSTF